MFLITVIYHGSNRTFSNLLPKSATYLYVESIAEKFMFHDRPKGRAKIVPKGRTYQNCSRSLPILHALRAKAFGVSCVHYVPRTLAYSTWFTCPMCKRFWRGLLALHSQIFLFSHGENSK